MIKEVMDVCLIGRDRKSERDGRDSISIYKSSLSIDYMMILILEDILILNSDSQILLNI